MDERLFVNYKPVNRKAKEFLIEEKEQPDPAYLYCLQLAVWGLETGGLAEDWVLEEQLKIMLGWNPEKVMHLLETDPADPREPINLASGQKTPLDLASAVLVRLRERIGPSLGLEPLPKRD